MIDEQMYERRGEEIARAMAHLAQVEAECAALSERALQVDYWQARASRAEGRVAVLELELAKLRIDGSDE